MHISIIFFIQLIFILWFVAGLLNHTSSWDFMKIALLACCCAIHNHGLDMLFSFSAIVQQTPCPPVGFTILRAGLMKSVLLSVYTSTSGETQNNNCSNGKTTSRVDYIVGCFQLFFLHFLRSFFLICESVSRIILSLHFLTKGAKKTDFCGHLQV
jgi:hypothetical protein